MRECCSGCAELRAKVAELAKLVWWLAADSDDGDIQNAAEEIAREVMPS